jgi:hypothetical protein
LAGRTIVTQDNDRSKQALEAAPNGLGDVRDNPIHLEHAE